MAAPTAPEVMRSTGAAGGLAAVQVPSGQQSGLPPGILPVSELFVSVQGEGLEVGLPTVFVRFWGCNLTCTWCDTKYTWASRRFTAVDVETIARRALELGAPWISLTGGEPLIQPAGDLLVLVQRWTEAGRRVNVETNGTIFLPELAGIVDRFSLSPKLGSAGQGDWSTTALRRYLADVAPEAQQWKLVIAGQEDLAEAHRRLAALPDVARLGIPIVLQPEGSTGSAGLAWLIETLSRDPSTAAAWSPYRVRILPQVHKVAFGNRRGY